MGSCQTSSASKTETEDEAKGQHGHTPTKGGDGVSKPKAERVETERERILRTQLRPCDRGRYSEAELNAAIEAYERWREQNAALGIEDEDEEEAHQDWLSEWLDLQRIETIEAIEAVTPPRMTRTEFNGFHSMPSPLTWNA